MKKKALLTLVLLLVCLSVSALAETWYVKTPNGKTVNMRDENRKVIAHIPYGTALVPVSDKCTEIVACVTYNGATGYVNWKYLVQDKPAPYRKSSGKTEEAEPGIYGEGQYSVSVTGGVLQFQNKKGKAAGTKYSEVKFDEAVSLVVSASVPKKKKIDYWLINGVKLQPGSKSLGIIGEDENVVIEIVYK